MISRSLYVAAVSLVLVGFWLRVARSPLPQAEAAQLSLPAASRPAAAGAGAGAVTSSGYAAIVATNIFSQMRTAPTCGAGTGSGVWNVMRRLGTSVNTTFTIRTAASERITSPRSALT